MEADDFVIIYSSQYISNPASMMGHTFLKFVRKGREDYLNRALGYAADMDEGVGAFAYIFKGLFGGFKGAWPENLYYEKVHEYNDMESRDMWEFRLNLTTEQREFLIDHIWELKNLADLNYFFIDENCSYVVLATLQAVLPEKDLLSAFPFYVVPLETAKKLDREGLISGQTYRPSLRNQTLSKYLALNESEQDEVRDSLRQQRIVSSKNSLVSETVIDFLDLKRQRQQGRLDPATTDFEKRIQSQRATLGQHPPLAIETPPSPLQGHRTFQAYLGLGQTDSMRKYGVLGFKPGVHGYFDKDQGYLKNSSFSFFETEVEWDKELSLSHLTLIDVGSMNAYSRLDPVFSWRFQTGLRKDQGLSNRKLSTYDVRPQWGISWDLSRDFDLSILGTALWQPVEFGGNAHRFWLGPHIEGSWRLQNKFKWVQQIALLKEFLEKENLTGAFLNSELRFFDFVNHWHLGASVTWNQFFTLRPNFFDFKGTVQFDF